MTYPVKIEFRDYPSGSWVDWSQYLVDAPTIDRRVESENEGEAGVIVFDNASVSFRYESGSPVYNAFSIDLSSKQRYLFRISAPKSDKTYVQLFEGMADFSTIAWTEDENVIAFEIVDKLSALALVSNGNNQRQAEIDSIATRIGTAPTGYESYTKGVVYVYDEANAFGHGTDVVIIYTMPTFLDSGWQRPADTLGDVTYSVSQSLLQTGETLDHPIKTSGKFDGEYNLCLKHGTGTKLLYTGGEATATLHYSWAKVDRCPEGMPLTSASTYGSRLAWANWVYEYFARCYDGWIDAYGYQVPILPECKYRTKQYYNNADVLLYNGDGSARAFDGIAVLSEIINQQWNGITLIRKPLSLSFEIPPTYSTLMVDNLPLGDEPLNTLKTLANTTESYIYINRDGNLVIQSKEDLPTNGNTQSLGNTRVVSKEKKYFWDKLADAAAVTVKSWVKDQYGEYLEGNATLTMQAIAGNGNSQPKNEIEKEILAPTVVPIGCPDIETQEGLDWYASYKATDMLQFYGRRHSAFEIELHLDDNVLDWELVDNITLDGVQCFFTSIEFDLVGKTARLMPVEIIGHNYDVRQVVVTYSEDNYNSSSGSSSGGGSTIIIGGEYGPIITALDGLDTTTGLLVQTGDSTFAKRKITALDAGKPDHLIITNPEGILGDINLKINTLAELQVAKVGIGGAVDAVFPFKVYGDSKFTGNITVDGNIYVAGNVNQVDVTEMHVADKVVRVNVDGDNTIATGSGIIVEGTGASDLASILYDGNWTHDKSVNVSSGLTYKINNVDRLSDTVVNLATGGAFKINSTDRLTADMVNLATGGAFKINSVDVLNETTLGNAVVNSSLTKVGTVITGVWNATKITAPYIDFNTTNLKNSTNLLNTIQDIAITSSPQFTNLTLTGKIDQQGTADSEFGSQYIVPKQKYYSNLGTLQKKWLTLHAAELWVETLVAQETIATIGGRVLVGPTSSLINDLTSGATTIDLKHNSFVSGDCVYMESAGKIEFIRINSSYTGITGGYRYNILRNLDGTGANDWYAGDAVFNTGQTGNGFIDLYSVRGIKSSSQYGPTIVGNIRNSSTYNDWSEAWAIGEMRGLYGYTSNAFGAGFGKYAANVNNIVVDSTNGIRFRNYDTVLASWNASTIELGEIATGKNHIAMTSDTIVFKNYLTVIAQWSGSNITLGEVGAAKANVLLTPSAIALRTNTTERIKLNSDGSGYVASNNFNWNTSGVITAGDFVIDTYKLYKTEFYIGGSSADYLSNYINFNTALFGKYNSTSTRLIMYGSDLNNFAQVAVVSGNPLLQARATVSGTNLFMTMGFLPSSDYGFSLREGTTDHFKFTKTEKFITGLTVTGDINANSFTATSGAGVVVEINTLFSGIRTINASNKYSFMNSNAIGIETVGSPPTEHLWIDATNLRFGGVKVIGIRRTGWTDQTATASRANLGSSPSTSSIASFLRALYDDLKTHGLIGN